MSVNQLSNCRPARASSAQSALEPTAALQPDHWLEQYGDELFGLAVARVRDPATAEDLVQETFLAALRSSRSFAGRSTERAWLFGILHNKLSDYFRQRGRELAFRGQDSPLPEEASAFSDSGLGKDGWAKLLAPKHWEKPDESLVKKEFWSVLRRCLSRMPEQTAQVFLLREIDGISSEEICKSLDVSANNLWVMLHRARLGLRRCLEVHWFRTTHTHE